MANYLSLNAIKSTLVLRTPRIHGQVLSLANSVNAMSSNSFSNLTAFVNTLSNWSEWSNLSLALTSAQSNVILSNLSNLNLTTAWLSNTATSLLNRVTAIEAGAPNVLNSIAFVSNVAVWASNAADSAMDVADWASNLSGWTCNVSMNSASVANRALGAAEWTSNNLDRHQAESDWASNAIGQLQVQVAAQDVRYQELSNTLASVVAFLDL